MRKLILILIVLVTMLGCSSTPTKNPPTVLAKFTEQTIMAGFDTTISFTAYTNKTSTFNEYFAVVKEEFLHYHELFDKYNNYDGINNVKTINDQAGIAPVKVDPVIIEMLLLSKEWYTKSKGSFDITIGAVLKIWHDYRDESTLLNQAGKDGLLPTKEELEEANKCVGWDFVEIDEANQSVYINNACASIDVGGVAKGFAAEKVAQTLESLGMNAGIVNAGGNIRVIGKKPNGEKWWVGIQDPNDLSENGASMDSSGHLESMSMVTSGDYQRYYTVDGVMYHHLIDPKTLQPGRYYRAASIVVKDSGVADIMSTVAFLLPYEEAKAIIEENGGNAIWITEKEDAFSADYGAYFGNYYVAVTKGLIPNLRKGEEYKPVVIK